MNNKTVPCNASFPIFLFYTTLTLFFLTRSSFSASNIPSKISYSDHCSSFVPERPIGYHKFSRSYARRQIGFYITKNLSSSVNLRISNIYKTDVQDLLGLDARLELETDSMHWFKPENSSTRFYRYLQFGLRGFWSQSSGRLCMVGEEKNQPRGEFKYSIAFPALLKLFNLYGSTNIRTLVSGNLENLVGFDENNPNYFDSLSIVLLPMLNYEYTLVMQEVSRYHSTSSTSDAGSLGLPLNSLTSPLCSVIFNRPMGLTFSSQCKSSSPAENCSPLEGFPGQLPDYLILQRIDCLESESRLRLLMKFGISTGEMGNYNTLDPKTTLFGEGIWDVMKNQLFVMACRFPNTVESWYEAQAEVSECSTRLVLSFPSVWTIGNTDSVVGRVWSTKTESDLGFFKEFGFHRSLGLLSISPDMKYEYKMIHKVENWCPRDEPVKSMDMKKYPDAFSNDMTFDIRGKTDKSRISIGYVEPISVGNQFYVRMSWHMTSFYISDKESSSDLRNVKNQTNLMSYRIHLVNVTWEPSGRFDVSAEGIYDVTTGRLCMVGCRNVASKSNEHALDCDILVNFQFPPKDSSGFIIGIIESKRKRVDPLYFESFHLSSGSFVASKAREYAQTTNSEIVLALVSNTLTFLFAVLQILHVKRNPDLLPYVSSTMLATLTLGNAMAPIKDVISMASASSKSQDVLLQSKGWLEAKGLIQGITVYLLFFLHARLLQLTWSSRMCHENAQTLWTAENETLVVSLPLYLGGAFLSIFLAWSKRTDDTSTISSVLITKFDENSIWYAVKCCVDVLLDGFLLPQVLFNVFRVSREKSLASSFYIGTTLARVLPHCYAIYKAQNSTLNLASVSWDVIISFGSILFAVMIYLQQKFGGRFICPFGLREYNLNEKIINFDVTET